MYIETSKITAAGQVTVPKQIRDLLNTNVITWVVDDNQHITIVPIKNVGGMLSKYAKKDNKSFDEIREIAWKSNTNQYNKED